MLIKTKAKSALKMLITLIFTLVLCTSVLLLIQKPSVVRASGQVSATTQTTSVNEQTSNSNQLPISKATAGSSAVYGEDMGNKFPDFITNKLVTSFRITTDSSKIVGFTKSENVIDSTSNDLNVYYKLAGYQVDTDDDGVVDADGYDIVVYGDVETIYAPENSRYGFILLVNCKSIIFDNFNTSNVTNMQGMFYGCTSLTSLDLSSFDTSKVTDMSYMFYVCSSLTSLNLSSFDTSKVTDMSGMFAGCTSLTSLDLSNFKAPADMSQIFKDLSALTSINLSNVDTSNVTNMSKMFQNCSSLTSLDLSSFNTSNVTDMSWMFDVCESLKTLTLGRNFKTSNVTTMNDMFSQCFSLKNLNVANFDTSKVTNMARMFWGCIGLKKLDISNFSFASITSSSNIEMMFGLSYEQVAQMFGLDVETFVNASFEEKVAMGVKASGYSEDDARSLLKKCGSIPCIVAPSNLNGLTITIPGEYNYTDGGEAVTNVLLAGKTHTLANASTDTSETGIISDSILLSLIALCFVFTGFVLLKRKKVR